MKIACVPDSFKGSVTAVEAAAAMASGARSIFDEDTKILELPFADGGEGSLDALAAAWQQQPEQVESVDAMGRPIMSQLLISPDERIGVVEVAQSNGLPLVSDLTPAPLQNDTYGVGLIIRSALARGVKEILICSGGSASSDGGTGMLRALGAKFLGADGRSIPSGGEGLQDIVSIDLAAVEPRVFEVAWRVAVDVDNPLIGPHGAARTFGPQKGATAGDVDVLETGLRQLLEVLGSGASSDHNLGTRAGMGAAGGLPLLPVHYLGAEIVPGAGLIAEELQLAAQLSDVSVILTGEGSFDEQSLRGKVVSAVTSYAHPAAAVVVLAGHVGLNAQQVRNAGITAAISIATGPTTLEQMRANSSELIESATAHVCALLKADLPNIPNRADPKKSDRAVPASP